MKHADLTDRDVLALTLYGEARGETHEGRVAVANVIRNRVQIGAWGHSYRAVCLAPLQFSCWTPCGGAQNAALVDSVAASLASKPAAAQPAVLRECFTIADAVMNGAADDNTGGADHYLTAELFQSPAAPKWAKSMQVTAHIGRHVFGKA